MLWNSPASRTQGIFCFSSKDVSEDNIIKFSPSWDEFLNDAPSEAELMDMSMNGMADRAGLRVEDFQKIINKSIREWRFSPSRSLMNVLENVDRASAGGDMFNDLTHQTRILIGCTQLGLFAERNLFCIRDASNEDRRRNRIKVASDALAMTAEGEQAEMVNSVCKAFYLWEERNRLLVASGKVKLPKKLYRGVRSNDVPFDKDRHPFLDGQPGSVRICNILEDRRNRLVSDPIADISRTSILSFTSNERIAEQFTKSDGYVIEIDPNDMLVVSSWSLDDALAGKDNVTNRNEREWIMRVPRGHILSEENVRTHALDMYAGTADPRGIGILEGFTEADYLLNGKYVRARFIWNASGSNGSIHFDVGDRVFPMKRSEVKRELGFDPIPRPDDLVEDLRYFNRKPFPFDSKREPIPSWSPDCLTNSQAMKG